MLRACVGTIAVASAVEALRIGATNIDRAYFGTDTRAYQLLAGALLALTPQLFTAGARYARLAGRLAPLALGALVLIGTSAWYPSAITRGVVVALVTFVLIVTLERSPDGAVSRGLSRPTMTYLGRISYGTYLWHWPIVVLVNYHHKVGSVKLFVISAVGSTALAALSFYFIEHPIRASSLLNRFNMRVIVIALAVSVVAGLVLMPAILEHGNSTTNATKASVSVPSLHTGKTTLVDWRTASTDIAALPDCLGTTIDHCTLVHGSGPRVLLLGDSFVRMWIPACVEIAKRESITLSVASYPTCPWQRSLEHGLGIHAAQCAAHHDLWYERIVPQFDPDVIILADQDYDAPGNPFTLPALGKGVLARSPVGERVIARASTASLNALRRPGRKIAILEPPPVSPKQGFDPVRCLSVRSAGCTFRVSSGPTPIVRFFRSAATQPDVWSVDLDRLVCPRLPICDPVINNIIVRRDHKHITATYSKALATSLDELLQKQGVLPRSSH